MSRQPRGAYRHKITLSVEETAHGRTVPRELRAQFYRLLDSVCREGKRAAENPRAQVLIDKLRPQLDTLLNHLYAKPQCQLSLIFTACHAAAVMAMVERGRECGRKEGRMRMERQHLLGERLTKAHREFQRVLKQPTFSPDPEDVPDEVKEAQQRSAAFAEILSILSLTISPPTRPYKGRPRKTSWRGPAHTALKLAGCSSRDETRLRKLFRF